MDFGAFTDLIMDQVKGSVNDSLRRNTQTKKVKSIV